MPGSPPFSHSGDLEVSMAKQYLDGAQVGADFEKMCGEATIRT
jgi:hypothetical protein